jgi:acid stress-induced BolA-like protein IbaG/YrbA
MELAKNIKVDQVEVVGDFHHVQVRTCTIILDGGQEISRSFHRHVIAPGEDYSKEEAWVQGICRASHTPEVIAAYEAAQAEAAAQMNPQE